MILNQIAQHTYGLQRSYLLIGRQCGCYFALGGAGH